jgi:hypothetical protein
MKKSKFIEKIHKKLYFWIKFKQINETIMGNHSQND